MRVLLLLVASVVPAFCQHAVSLSVQWQDDTGDLAAGATVTIQFQRSTTSGSGYANVGSAISAVSAARTTYSYVDSSGLLPGTTYYYVALVQDSNGNSASTPQIAETIPALVNGRHLSAAVQ